MRHLHARPTILHDAEWRQHKRPAYVVPLKTRSLPLIPRVIRAVENWGRR